jgi:hypothetical protein
MEEQAQQKLMAEFKKLTENLHHLLSTKQRPGVFCGPTEVREAGLVYISGIHLKAVVIKYRTDHLAHGPYGMLILVADADD